MATATTVEKVLKAYGEAPVEKRPTAADVSEEGVLLEFDYHGRARQVVPVEVSTAGVEGYVQTDTGDASGAHDDNDAPYKAFIRAKMKNVKVVLA